MNWKASKHDYEVAAEIARRAVTLFEEIEGKLSRQRAGELHRTILMDIIATHANGCPLNLRELMTAPRFDFSHDVFGIYRQINRDNGQLQDCFLPRYSL